MKKGLTYRGSGVDIDEGLKLVRKIKPSVRSTARPGVIGGIGGFAGLFSARFKGMKDPVLVSATDGVGTKLMVAFMAERHDTVGEDLVAMSVNDILVCGAEPLFFLDYLATGALDADKAADVIKGIARGCKTAGCALLGGETAEMPGMYSSGEYDLAGFCVGVADRKKMIDGTGIRPGDELVGLGSSGLHSNGYSLARKVLFEKMGLGVKDRPRGMRKNIGSELLTPTRIYVKPVLDVLKKFDVRGMAHITGGGFQDNIPRVLPEYTEAVVEKNWPVKKIFTLIREGGSVEEAEMLRTFNCGIGMVLAVRKGQAGRTVEALKKLGEKAYRIGEVRRSKRKAPRVEFTGRLFG